MTVLILAGGGDSGAAAVASAVAARRGACAVTVVSPRRLAVAKRWVHTVAPDGTTATEIRLADGGCVPSSPSAVLTRIDGVPPVRFARAGARDRDYAAMELHALFVSWLAGLPCPVVNPVNGNGSAAPAALPYWLLAARRAGLPVVHTGHTVGTRAGRYSPPPERVPVGSVLVAGRHVTGDQAGRFGEGCAEVARATGCPLLEFRFAREAGAARLSAVDPRPALHDPAHVAVVAGYLVEVAS
ncbi:hypothetical protein [Amycolatopsis sp. Hca4]|uniref:hypothetical protein n=1 Tax=Amycolatopsis sp. Hca4 TaxID=2742131 RepID=UPI001591E34F|nr:hypothetical protein [Amycolatopsis sp. Hca4]QKV72713.1 hypothetical protein HUT10_01790 [Amycolatopsis sp. Hca4]